MRSPEAVDHDVLEGAGRGQQLAVVHPAHAEAHVHARRQGGRRDLEACGKAEADSGEAVR